MFHISCSIFPASNHLFGKSPFSDVAWCVASACSNGKLSVNQAQQEARRQLYHSHPKIVPNTNYVSKVIFLLSS